MKRILAALAVLALLGVAGALAYQAASRERDYRRLIEQGEAALAQEQTYVAIEALSGAIALRPDSMLAYLRRGETHRRRSDFEAALRDLRAAVRLDPSATPPREQLGDVNFVLRRDGRAAESYDAYIRLDDRSPRLLYKLALARHREGNPAVALSPLQQAVALNDRFAEAYYLMGLCLRELGRVEEAVAALQRAVTAAPALAAPREELADLFSSLGRHQEEVEQLAALAALDPGRAERHITVGLAYARASLPDMAVVTLGRAAERFPQQPGVYAALGRVWLQTAETRADKAALRKALEALSGIAGQPSATSEALTLYGRALYLAEDAEGAARALEQATQKRPVEPDAFLHFAAAAERLGRIADARAALVDHATLVGEDQDFVARATRIGDLSLRLNEPAVASAWFQRAIDAAEPDPRLLGRLAEAQFRAGDSEAARATLARALEKDPRSRTLLRLQWRLRPMPPPVQH